MGLILYLLLLIFELLFFAGFAVFTFFLIYSQIKGSPFVPTGKKEQDIILAEARLQKNQLFVDLGCGDGRVVREAVRKYQTKGIGIEVNPILLILCRLYSRLQNLKQIRFIRLDIVNQELPKADIIYIFLMPNLIKKISEKLRKKVHAGSLVISHGFKIDLLAPYLIKTIERNPFPTYFYKAV